MPTPQLLEQTAGCATMGLSYGLNSPDFTPKLKNRWLMRIPGVSADGVNSLPPQRGARPEFSMKEFEFPHINEDVYYPLKGSWGTVTVVLYDIACNGNPVFDWLNVIYTVSSADVNFGTAVGSGLMRDVLLELYDGSGNVLETWMYQNAYPSSVSWGDLDMASGDIVVCQLTLRYTRAVFSPTGTF